MKLFGTAPNKRVAAIAQSVERILGKDEVSGPNPDSSSRKKRIAKAIRFFQRNSFLTERVKYAIACEIAYGSEIRLRRVKERISFHILRKPNISL